MWHRRHACLHHPSHWSLNGECWPSSATPAENRPQTISETGATPVPLHGSCLSVGETSLLVEPRGLLPAPSGVESPRT
jgi:hypothetical protein